jgi:HK97 family phage major capsid protein
VIPTTTFNQVIDGIQSAQGVLQECRILKIPGKLSLPASAVTSEAVWHTEGAVITASEQPPTSVALSGYELVKVWDCSVAMQAMAIPAFEEYLTGELIRCTKDALCTAVFTGAGTTQPLGLATGISWDASNSVAVGSNQIWETLGGAMSLLSANFRQDAIWVMNSDMFYNYVLIENQGTTNAPMIVQNVAAGAPLTLFGKRVVIDDHCPDDTAYFGNFGCYVFNFSQDITVERSTEAKFSSGLIVYRSIAVVDGKPAAPAFVKITKTS